MSVIQEPLLMFIMKQDAKKLNTSETEGRGCYIQTLKPLHMDFAFVHKTCTNGSCIRAICTILCIFTDNFVHSYRQYGDPTKRLYKIIDNYSKVARPSIHLILGVNNQFSVLTAVSSIR